MHNVMHANSHMHVCKHTYAKKKHMYRYIQMCDHLRRHGNMFLFWNKLHKNTSFKVHLSLFSHLYQSPHFGSYCWLSTWTFLSVNSTTLNALLQELLNTCLEASRLSNFPSDHRCLAPVMPRRNDLLPLVFAEHCHNSLTEKWLTLPHLQWHTHLYAALPAPHLHVCLWWCPWFACVHVGCLWMLVQAQVHNQPHNVTLHRTVRQYINIASYIYIYDTWIHPSSTTSDPCSVGVLTMCGHLDSSRVLGNAWTFHCV